MNIKKNIITSAVKAYSKAVKNGKLNLTKLAIYDLIHYYHNFTLGKKEYLNEQKFLAQKMEIIKYCFPDDICNYNYLPGIPNLNLLNTAPTSADLVIDLEENQFYNFKVNDFFFSYFDQENDPYKYLMIYPSTDISKIKIKYNGTEVTNNLVINVEGMNLEDELNLQIERIDNSIFPINIYSNFRVSDNPVNYLYSQIYNISVLASSSLNQQNQPPVLGDNTIYVDNRAITELTLAMFTSQLTPPYNDPEGDLIDAIKIDEISTANEGVFLFNDLPVQVGDIITREDLEAGLFVHEGPNQDTISSDVINFSARDEGSLIWVQ